MDEPTEPVVEVAGVAPDSAGSGATPPVGAMPAVGAPPLADPAPAGGAPPLAESTSAAGAYGQDIEVSAPKLSLANGQYIAEGGVTITFAGQRLVAQRAEGTMDVLVLTNGVWYRPGSELQFDSATIHLRAREGTVSGAKVVFGGAILEATALAVKGEDAAATDATLLPCACDDGLPPAVRFTAKHIDVVDAKVAVVRGGVVRIFTVPVVPVPYWRVPLDPDAFRLSVPEIGYGDPGLSARWHGTWGVGDYRFDAGPAWRQDRGGRIEAGVDGPVRLKADLGWDDVSQTVRGGLATDGGFAGDWAGDVRMGGDNPLRDRFAWDASVLSDSNYAEDYGVAYVDRGVLFRESRVVGQVGALRLSGWLPDTKVEGGTFADFGFAPRFGSAYASVTPTVGLGLVGAAAPSGLDSTEAEASDGVLGSTGLEGLLSAGLAARASRTWGPVHGEAKADGYLLANPAEIATPRAVTTAEARAELATWGDGPLGRFTLFPGVVGRSGWMRDEAGLSAFSGGVGPSVRAQSRLLNTIATVSVAGLWDGSTLSPEVAVDVVGEKAALRATVADDAQAAEIRGGKDLTGRLGFLHVGSEWFTFGEVGAHLGRFVSGVGLTLDPVADALDARVIDLGDANVAIDGVTGRVGYDDGCSAFVLTAALAPDRDLPDFGAQIVLRK